MSFKRIPLERLARRRPASRDPGPDRVGSGPGPGDAGRGRRLQSLYPERGYRPVPQPCGRRGARARRPRRRADEGRGGLRRPRHLPLHPDLERGGRARGARPVQAHAPPDGVPARQRAVGQGSGAPAGPGPRLRGPQASSRLDERPRRSPVQSVRQPFQRPEERGRPRPQPGPRQARIRERPHPPPRLSGLVARRDHGRP